MRVGTDVVSVMAAYSDLVCVCMVHCAKKYRICRHNADVCNDTHSWTRLV